MLFTVASSANKVFIFIFYLILLLKTLTACYLKVTNFRGINFGISDPKDSAIRRIYFRDLWSKGEFHGI